MLRCLLGRAAFEGALASFVIAAGSAAALAVPFTYVHHEVLVDVWIGDAGPYAFMLDTDTSPSIVDLGLARRLRLPMHGSPGQGSGIGSAKVNVIPLTIPNVRVGAVRVARLDALAMDLSGIGAGLGRRIDGVLGTSFLRDRIVEIDYPCRTVSFLPGAVLAPFAARFDGDGVGANSSGDQNISNDVWIGSHRVLATFDTGDSGASFVSIKGIADLKLQAAARSGRASVTQGFGGNAPATAGTLKHVRIGQKQLGMVTTSFFPTTSAPFDINIGNETWEHFIAVFDYQRGLLTLIAPRSCTGRT
jgi:hypothetical protein